MMTIRPFQSGDAAAQVSIYNEAAGELPKFKPATLDEVRRRLCAAAADPTARFVAVENGQPVGYASFAPNGRVSYPWCRKGYEHHAESLFQTVLAEMRRRGMRTAFAAYRSDWPTIGEFFLTHGFRLVREMVNFVVLLSDLPTPAARASYSIEPILPGDITAVLALGEGVIRAASAAELEQHLFHNPFFPPESVFVVRGRADGVPVAVGLLVVNPTYADPQQVDAGMPCFRLGAFGSEGQAWKRINGLFSFVTRPGKDLNPLALDLLFHAAGQLLQTDLDALAAQVPSDAPHLLRFYEHIFRRQGSFPIYELAL